MKDYNTNGAFTTTERKKLTPDEIDERKGNRAMLIGEKAQHAMEFEMRVSRHLRSLGCRSYRVCAEVLREILFWEMSDAVIRRDFWMYRIYECKGGCGPDSRGHCCWEAGGVTRRNMDTARKVLVGELGLLEERRWYGGKVYYRVNHRALITFLATMEATHEQDGVNEFAQFEQDEQSGVYETSNPECTFRTVSKQRASSESNFIPPTESTPDGETLKSEDKESHERQHDTSTSTTSPREPEPLSVGEEIARYTHRYMKECYGSGLTPVEFSAVVKDVNEFHEERYGPTGKRETPITEQDLYDAAEWLVDCYMYSYDGRAYPPRADGPLLRTAFQATKFGNPPRKL